VHTTCPCGLLYTATPSASQPIGSTRFVHLVKHFANSQWYAVQKKKLSNARKCYEYSVCCLDVITTTAHYRQRYHPMTIIYYLLVYLFIVDIAMLSIPKGYTVTSDEIISQE
jgi:hypothetical protein